MRYSTPKLKFALAGDALIHFFNYQYSSIEEINFTENFCQSCCSDNFRKLKLRVLCEENNDIIVAAVLADANPEEQTFLYGRYRRNLSFVNIGMNLHIHPNDLQRWRDKFLTDIASLLEYKLPLTDVFSRNKIEALIFVLERTIVFHETYGNFNRKFLNNLKFRLETYQNLLFTLKQFLNSHSLHIGVKIIQMKILNPNITSEELKKNLEVSHTTVSHYVQLFHQKFYPQISA